MPRQGRGPLSAVEPARLDLAVFDRRAPRYLVDLPDAVLAWFNAFRWLGTAPPKS